jgi:glycosyl transferase family 25
MSINSINDITNIFYINLEHRTDRKEHVETELLKIGLTGQRFNAIKMDNGAIGCSMSHLKLLQDAVKNNLEHILIVEDDITFLNPTLFINQINKFFKLHKNSWDVILFAGNNIPPYQKIDDTCIKVFRCQTTTGYLVNGHYIKNLLQNVKMGLTHLLNNPLQRNQFAIDKYWFILQSLHKWYLIIPPTVVQQEGYSDIEKRVTNFEKHMQDLDKTEFLLAMEMKKLRL